MVAYTYEEAENNIPPYSSNFQEKAISKRTISLEDQKHLMLDGKDIAEINYEGTDLEKSVTNKGANAMIICEFMEESIKDTNDVLPGKTIFFFATMKLALRLEELFDAFFPHHHEKFAKILVSDDTRVYGKSGLLNQSENKDITTHCHQR